MAITLYAELKTALSNWTERNDTAFTNRVDEFIDLAEADHKRRIRTRGLLTRAEATTTAASRYLALPTGYLAMRTLRLETTPVVRMTQVGLDEMVSTLYQTVSGKPLYFAVHEELEFNKPFDAAYTITMIYWKAVDALSDSNTSNWILTNHPDAYLFGSLVHAYDWLQDFEKRDFFELKYEQVLSKIQKADLKDQWSQGGIKRRPALHRIY